MRYILAVALILATCNGDLMNKESGTATTGGRISGHRNSRRTLPPTPLVPIVSPPQGTSHPAALRLHERKNPRTNAPEDDDWAKTLVGNYMCDFEAEDLPVGPFKLAGFGCKIYETDDDLIKLGRTSKGLSSLTGEIRRVTESGFLLNGVYKFPGNGLTITVEMKRGPAPAVVYKGRGLGTLNSGGEARRKFVLTLTKSK